MRNARRGFTLVEILVIIAFVGVLFGIVAPKVSTVKTTYDLIEAAEQVAGDLRRAQSEARRLNRAIQFIPAGNGASYQIAELRVTETRRRQGNREIVTVDTAVVPLVVRALPNGISLRDPAILRVEFRPFGPALVNGATAPARTTLSVVRNANSRSLTLGSLGEVRVQ